MVVVETGIERVSPREGIGSGAMPDVSSSLARASNRAHFPIEARLIA
jgi:hypothetical protein